MLLREMSDLHNEFSLFEIPEMPEDKETVLVLAGDIDLAKNSRLVAFLEKASNQFSDIIYVFGNHEFYKSSIISCHDYLRKELALNNIFNVHILENASVEINNTIFIGSTLWTSMDKGNPLTMEIARAEMNDYKHIRIGPSEEPWRRKLLPHDTVSMHSKSKQFMFEECKKAKQQNKKVVMISHHGPSFMSVSEGFRGSPLNGAYLTDLDYDIIDSGPDIWFHGHVHQTFKYDIETTTVYTNPRGYCPQFPNVLFDPYFRINV